MIEPKVRRGCLECLQKLKSSAPKGAGLIQHSLDAMVQNGKMDTTPQCSHVVPHHSTNWAQYNLTSEFGWDLVHFV